MNTKLVVKRLYQFRYWHNISIINTLRFNLRFFKLKDALQLPVIIFKGTTLHLGSEAKVILHCPLKTGILWIGAWDAHLCPHGSKNYIYIDGTLHISNNVRLNYHTKCIVKENATLVFGGENYINHDCQLLVSDCVNFAYGSRIGWNTQISDSSFHYISINNKVSRKSMPISIGRETWISSFCNISRGACLPDYSILANCSLLNKDFSKEGTHLFIAGIPAKVIKKNAHRIMEFVEPELCNAIDKYFNDNPTITSIELSTISNENR